MLELLCLNSDQISCAPLRIPLLTPECLFVSELPVWTPKMSCGSERGDREAESGPSLHCLVVARASFSQHPEPLVGRSDV